MPPNRKGRALNIWLKEETMQALDQWAEANGTTKTEAVSRAIELLTGTLQPADEDLIVAVSDLQQRMARVEAVLKLASRKSED